MLYHAIFKQIINYIIITLLFKLLIKSKKADIAEQST